MDDLLERDTESDPFSSNGLIHALEFATGD